MNKINFPKTILENIELQNKKINEVVDNINEHLENHPSGGADSGLLTKKLTSEEINSIINASYELLEVENIVVSSNYLNINVGETRQLTYTLYPSGASSTVSFTSSDSTICSVDNYGNIRALNAGEVLITLTCDNGIKTDCQVVINEVGEQIEVTSINLNISSIELKIDETVTLTPEVIPYNATNKSVVWESDNIEIATVINGIVTGVGNGICNIKCKSVSNPEVVSVCTITVKTVQSLTSITNGLEHSYDFTNLNGNETVINDLTGDVVLKLSGFNDVSSSKTTYGIVTDNNDCRFTQGNVSSATDKYSIAVTVMGTIATSQGLFTTSGLKVGTSNVTNNITKKSTLCLVKASFLMENIPITYNTYKYDTIVLTLDFVNNEIILYTNGYKMSTVSMEGLGITWDNSIALNNGHWGGATGLCYKNLLLYNRCLSENEVLTLTNEINDKAYTNVNTNNSSLINGNDKVVEHYSFTNEIVNNIITSEVTGLTLENVNSSDENGFNVSNSSLIKQNFPYSATYIIKFKNDDFSSQKKILQDSATGRYIYLNNGKFYIRSSSIWVTSYEGIEISLNDLNVLYIETQNLISRFYFNNILIFTKENENFTFNTLVNTDLKITDYILLDGILNEELRNNIYNELTASSQALSLMSLNLEENISSMSLERTSQNNITGKIEAIISPSSSPLNEVITLPFNIANSIYFNDGKTLQQKYDNGELGTSSDSSSDSSSGNENIKLNYIPNKWYGKKIVCLGDSITASGYPIYIGEVLGAIIDNKGSSGGTYVRDWEIIQSVDWTYVDAVTYMTGQNKGASKEESIGASGLYDVTDWENYGSYPSNFYGGVAKIVNYIRKQNPKIKIYFIGQANSGQNIGGDNTPSIMREKFIELSQFLSVPFIDTFSHCGINYCNWSEYSSDGVHINEEGKKLVGKNAAYEMMYL